MYTLEQLSADHQYYCSDCNYYSNDAGASYESWEDFYEEYKDSDIDYNLVFRWDIKRQVDEEENQTGFYLEVFVMQQRKGKFTPLLIQNIKEENVPEIISFLTPRFEHLKKLWEPFI
jgi:hypothetical protein